MPAHQPIGVIKKEADGFQVRFERVYNQSIDEVWDAITNPEKLGIWFADTIIEPNAGGKIQFRFRDKNQTEGDATITRWERGKLFEYLWDGELATWEIFPEGPLQCKLIFTYSRMGEEWLIQATLGWHTYLVQLEGTLKGHKDPYPYRSQDEREEKLLRNSYEKSVNIITGN